MKLYVVPVENICNGNCAVCITKFKKEIDFGRTLKIDQLKQINSLEIDKIEITGGGEPFLHEKIEDIVKICSKKAPTQIYTNGYLLKNFNREIFKSLFCLCLSRFHYGPEENAHLMGVRHDDATLSIINGIVPVKLSLVLCNSGINCAYEIKEYFEWAIGLGIKKVVVRQMFDFDQEKIKKEYLDLLKKEYVSSEVMFRELNVASHSSTEQGNPVFKWKDLEVEFEFRSCACEIVNPVFRGNGNIYLGWTDILWKR